MSAGDGIRTTHVGSLPRPQEVVDLLFAEDRGEPIDRDEYDATMAAAVAEAVRRQAAVGIDLVSDGEMSKISYATYVRHRLTGFEPGEVPRATPWDLDDFPEYRDRLAAAGGTPKYQRPICTGPIAPKDPAPLDGDLRRLRAALDGANVAGAFVNAASPGVIAVFQLNRYYPDPESYLGALADAMRPEYEAIVAAGFDLQIDCPDLAMGRHIAFRDLDEAAFVRRAELQVEALNAALANVPAERVRLHLCWGNYEGPHTHDVPLAAILPAVLKAKPRTLLFEAANPRHAHEWRVWAEVDLPDDVILAPGVIDTTTNFVEHPELVAERLGRFVGLVGKERVIAGTDCGFGTFAGFGAVHPSICWAKLRSLSEGAALASARAG
ncbi:MAG: cobalamin-independent methionine synthase II family protein [Chloroflexota bacterium]|nr:cobalamin-independent methionine synthase II family protein [Chloroflexota bacterium]